MLKLKDNKITNFDRLQNIPKCVQRKQYSINNLKKKTMTFITKIFFFLLAENTKAIKSFCGKNFPLLSFVSYRTDYRKL